VLAFGLLAALLAATVAGLLPAVRAALPERFRGLKGTRSSAGRTERRLLSAVATLQVVLTVALLAGAALLIRTATNLAKVRPGYDTENILAMTVTTVQRDSVEGVSHAGVGAGGCTSGCETRGVRLGPATHG
jgi:putative ABC transport system permease protein